MAMGVGRLSGEAWLVLMSILRWAGWQCHDV